MLFFCDKITSINLNKLNNVKPKKVQEITAFPRTEFQQKGQIDSKRRVGQSQKTQIQ